MKVQELLENQEQGKVVLRTDNIDEYTQAIEKLSNPDERYHYEEISPEGSEELFDVVVEVFNYSYQPQTRHDPEAVDIDWDAVYYGTGNFDEENAFYIVEGRINLSAKDYTDIEERLIEDQAQQKADEYDERGDYERTMRKDEPNYF